MTKNECSLLLMKKQWGHFMFKSFLLGSIFVVSMTNFATEYPVNVKCVNPNNDKNYILLGVNFIENTSTLIYQNEDAKQYVVASGWTGYYAHSSVSFENYTGGGLNVPRTLTFSGSSSQALRVVHYANFDLKLKVEANGLYSLVKLNYAFGIDAFPEKSFEGTVENKAMSCSIQGM